jgi:formate dehydrogenase major subunit
MHVCLIFFNGKEVRALSEKEKKKFKLSRRQFLKATAAGVAAGPLADWIVKPKPAGAADSGTPTTCPYCSLGCGMIGYTDASGNIIDITGDPVHPYNEGAQCSKGASNWSLMNSPARILTGPKKRIGNGPWQDISWEQAISEIAAELKRIKFDGGPGISGYSGADQVAFLGSSHLTNEECYLYRKLIALFGTNNIEHQARI